MAPDLHDVGRFWVEFGLDTDEVRAHFSEYGERFGV